MIVFFLASSDSDYSGINQERAPRETRYGKGDEGRWSDIRDGGDGPGEWKLSVRCADDRDAGGGVSPISDRTPTFLSVG